MGDTATAQGEVPGGTVTRPLVTEPNGPSAVAGAGTPQQDPLLELLDIQPVHKAAPSVQEPPELTNSLTLALVVIVGIYLLTRRTLWVWGFMLSGGASIFFSIVSLVHLRILSALGFYILGLVFIALGGLLKSK